jgi:hypothetical protein
MRQVCNTVMKKLPLQVKFRIWVNDVDRFSFYFFLFFSSFVFGNLFPSISLTHIFSTSLQPFRFFLGFLGPLWAISIQILHQIWCKTVSRILLISSQNEDASSIQPSLPQAQQSWVSRGIKVTAPTELRGLRQAKLDRVDSEIVYTVAGKADTEIGGRFRDLKPGNSASAKIITTQQATNHLVEKPDLVSPWASLSSAEAIVFELPNFLSAAAAVCLYEFFSYLEHRLLGVPRSTKLMQVRLSKAELEASIDQVEVSSVAGSLMPSRPSFACSAELSSHGSVDGPSAAHLRD